jgi:hypothetical protein
VGTRGRHLTKCGQSIHAFVHALMIESIRDLYEMHLAAGYPPDLAGDAEVDGISLILLDADIAGLAQTFLADGRLRPDQWYTLRQCRADTQVVLRQLAGEEWVYFARLHALAQALLRSAPEVVE